MTDNELSTATDQLLPSQVTPIALTIAGSDSGGGAGIQADLKTFSALGVYGASVITALTAQNTVAVTAIHTAPPDMVEAQLHAVLDDLNVRAIKIGMLSSAEVIDVISRVLQNHQHIPIVLDPVMVAKSGDKLLRSDALQALQSKLVPLAHVITPNLPEAALLLKTDEAQSMADMREQVEDLIHLGAHAVLLKGGHLAGDVVVDVLRSPEENESFTHPKIQTANTHGTGCTLSAAIASQLAHGDSLLQAVTTAEHYLQQAILAADDLNVGKGHGPVHHFHELWSRS